MTNVYQYLLSLGADPTEIQRLMSSMQARTPNRPLITPNQPGMRGDIAARAPVRSQPSGIYQPMSRPGMGRRI